MKKNKFPTTQAEIEKIYPLGTERTFANQLIRTRLKCDHQGCRKYIQGVEGYNGYFYYKGKKPFSTRPGTYDLRNKIWLCDKHC
jgi:hypothetical protein